MRNVNVARPGSRQRGLVVIAAAIGMTTSAMAGTHQLRDPYSRIGRLTLDSSLDMVGGLDRVAPGRMIGGDAIATYTGGGAAVFSDPLNWSTNPNPPAANDDLVFGAAPAGNYTLVNDINATVFNNVSVNRANAADTTTIQGGLSGVTAQVTNGRLVFDGGTSTFTGDGTSNAAISLLAGSLAGSNGSIVLENGAVVNGVDLLAGGATFSSPTINAAGSLTVRGTGTRFQPVAPGTTDGYFGSTLGDATVRVEDGGAVTAWRGFLNDRGSLTVTTGGTVTLNPLSSPNPGTSASIARAQVGGATNANVSFEISEGGSVIVNNNTTGADVFANASRLGFGNGPNSTTTGNVLSGGLLQGGIFYFGGAENTISINPTASNSVSTLTISGADSRVVATDSFSTNGTVRFSNNYLGQTTVNVLDGGSITAIYVALNGADRTADNTTATHTDMLVSGADSTITATNGAGGGVFFANYGDRATSTLTVENGGTILADNFAAGVSLVGGSNTINVNAGGSIIAGGMVGGDVGNITTINVNGGGIIDLEEYLDTAAGLGGELHVNVDGANSRFSVGDQVVTGGYPSDISSGKTIFTASDGGLIHFGILFTGAADALPEDIDPEGTVLTATGAGSTISVQDGAVLGYGLYSLTTVNVLDGGLFKVLDQTDGGIDIAGGPGSSVTVNVDGPGSTFDGGSLVTMSQSYDTAPTEEAVSVMNVKNGGVVTVAGNLQLAVNPAFGNSATLNIGGGSDALNDPDSAVLLDGALFVGGSGDIDAPEPGAPAVVHLNDGTISAAAVLVYQGSQVNVTRGLIAAGTIGAYGGNIVADSSTPAGEVVFLADEFEVGLGAHIDIGKGGGVSVYSTSELDLDLGEIRGLIEAGFNGGTWDGVNSIRSGAIVPDGDLAIGYTDIVIAGITEFLGIEFEPGDDAIVFRTTLKGDSNLDGAVNFDDLLILAQNYNQPGDKLWYHGDSNYDGEVGFDDLLAVAQNYNSTFSLLGVVPGDASAFDADWKLAQSLVPEPATLGLLGAGLLLTRRRRA